MSVLGGFGRLTGGALLFIGLLTFIILYSLNNSGVLSNSYFSASIGQIVNASSSTAYGAAGYNSSQRAELQQTLVNFTQQNPGCANLLCFATKQLNLNIPTSQNYLFNYEFLAAIAAIIGVVLLILSYEGGERLQAIGRGSISAAIISFVSTYLPLVFILPYLFSIPIQGLAIKIPASVMAPFTNLVLILDIIFGVIGVVLLIIRFVFFRRSIPKPIILQGMRTEGNT